MLIEKQELKLRTLVKDPIARLLFLNALLVIIGYALANITQGASVGIFGNIKNLFLFFSFSYLIITGRIVNPKIIFDSGYIPIIFSLLLLYISIGTKSDLNAYFKTLTFFVPMLYIYLSLSYLILNFGIQATLRSIHYGLLIIYAVPILTFLLSGAKISETNIYGSGGENQAFGSNNYGWAATLFLLSYLFVWKEIKLTSIFRFFFAILLPFSIFLLLVSANRSSWLSVGIAMIPFFFSYKKMALKYKIIGMLFVFSYVTYLFADPNSSINFVIDKTRQQEQHGEMRFETANVVLNYFNDEPSYWITGIGMFNFSILRNKSVLHAYHNSYYEVLFGAGIPLFLVFLSFMFFRPTLRYIKYYSRYSLLLPPLLILPFFESDLTGGQFLFFPWFTFILLLNAKTKFWNRETFKESIQGFNNKKTILDEANNTII